MTLEVSGLSFSYGNRAILKGVSFKVNQGEILGVLGVNGAGKSTLLHCLNRINQPQGGRILLDGKNLLEMDREEIARFIGYMPQGYREGDLTVFDMVLLGRKPYLKWGVTKEDVNIVEEIISKMRLTDYALRPISELSGGEAQKVVLARALAQQPKILLLDEPTSNLDLKNQLEVMTMVANAVKREQLSAIIAVHDLNLALRFADRFILLHKGTIHSCLTRDELTARCIEEVYGVKVLLGEIEGFPVIIPTGIH